MVNLTLIVQMIHFGIAYLILDRILLRSVMKIVRHEDDVLTQVQQQVAATTAEIVGQQQEKEHAWHIMQQTLLQQRPQIEPAAPHVVPSVTPQVYELPAQEVTRLVQQFKTLIVERISHARDV